MSLSTTSTILIIDDDEVIRDSISEYLEDSGFVTEVTASAEQGLEVFTEINPSLVITDMNLPGKQGIELIEELMELNEQLPVIVITGESDIKVAISALKLGACDFMQKPISDLAMLEHAVCRALERIQLINDNREYQEKLKKSLAILEEDQVAGKSVQQKLLPDTDRTFVGGIHCTHRVIPAIYLSGDFVGYFDIDDEHAAIYLSDVSGHGASSAFVTVLLKSLLFQILSRYQVHGDQTIYQPAHLLSEIAEEVYTARLGKYMTMIYGVMNLKTHKMKYAIGGHYPNPVFLKANGDADFIKGGGFPVGIMKNTKYEEHELEFEPGDKLAMYSDGVLEVYMNDQNTDIQEVELIKLTQKTKANVDEIFEILGVRDDDTEQPDDVSMVVVTRNP